MTEYAMWQALIALCEENGFQLERLTIVDTATNRRLSVDPAPDVVFEPEAMYDRHR